MINFKGTQFEKEIILWGVRWYGSCSKLAIFLYADLPREWCEEAAEGRCPGAVSPINPQTTNLQLPESQHSSTGKPSVAIPASPLLITAENLVVVLNCSAPQDPPALCLFDREGTLQKKISFGAASRQSDPLRPIDLALTDEGTIVVLYTKYWLATDGGVMKFDQQLNLLSHEPRTWAQPVRGLAAARGAIVIADEKQMYIYDSELRLQYREGAQSAERAGYS